MIDHSIYWNKGLSYQDYRNLIDSLLAENKTSGLDHSPGMLDYTKMNVQRMKRHEKTFVAMPELLEKLKGLESPEKWLVITEAWCGDAAQNIPQMQKLAENSNGKVEFRLVFRDENLELMDAYLTNGVSRSIPILIRLNALTFEPLGHWGPRPLEAQQLFIDGKKNNTPGSELKEALHLWYARNKSENLQQELLAFY